MNSLGVNNFDILVTGATGLMGLPITRALARHNRVIGAARFTSGADKAALEAAGAKTVALDLVKPNLDVLPEKVDIVIHLGAFLPGAGATDPANRQCVFDANVHATGLLMSRYRGCKAFVFAASGSSYAYQGERPLREEDPYGLHNSVETYAVSKIGAEFLIQYLSREWQVPAVILRIFSLYSTRGGGPTARIDQVAKGGVIPLYPDVANRYNIMYEDDYVEKTIRAIGIAKTPAEIVNFAGSQTTTVEEYCSIAGEMLGRTPVFQPTSPMYPIWPDVTKMERLLGPTRISVREGVRRVVEAGPTARMQLMSSANVLASAPVQE